MKTLVRSLLSFLSLAAVMSGPSSSVASADDAMASVDPHAQHHMAMPKTTHRLVDYRLPSVMLVREDGKTVSLPEELNDGRPVVLSFVFTTCTAICPVISHTFVDLQRKLGADRDRVHLATVSIDPENDTPAQLAAYAKKYGAGPEWHSYTGTFAASAAVQRAFSVYRGDKMDHTPVAFLRAAPGKKWVRIDGFPTADQLLTELRGMLAANESHSADSR